MKKLLSTAALLLRSRLPRLLCTAYGSGPDCEHRHRAGCYSSRGIRSSSPLHNLNEGSGLLGAAPSMKVEGLAAPVAPGTESPQLLRQ
jgi:hypothetical protein